MKAIHKRSIRKIDKVMKMTFLTRRGEALHLALISPMMIIRAVFSGVTIGWQDGQNVTCPRPERVASTGGP